MKSVISHLMPAAGKISRASMKALPTIPNILSTPWATIVSVKASLEVIVVGLLLHAGSSGLGVEVEKRVHAL